MRRFIMWKHTQTGLVGVALAAALAMPFEGSNLAGGRVTNR
jgi:hypothetical protein